MYKILLAEDDTVIRENICTYLEMSGYQCTACQNGKDAIEAIETETPDLIICDIMMPVMDGYEVFSELKKNSHTFAIPVIFLTAKADKTEIDKGIKLGAEYVTKPFELKYLLSLIKDKIKK